MMTIISSLSIIILAVYLLAIITDAFFIKSLDQISQKLHLPENVAGASLMAMGSSAPELAIALLAVFKDGGSHSAVGIGTIVGSAVFNILVITGISAIVKPTQVDIKASIRDSLIYVASILLLLLVFLDAKITLIETSVFLALYVVYLFILLQWDKFFPKNSSSPSAERSTEAPTTSHKNILQHLNHFLEKLLGFLAGNPTQSYIRAFVVSIIFIGGLSWVLVDYAIIFANAVHIPPVIVALTILAAGTSAPDLIASIIVAKQGRGSMAIANAIGSNIFDILIGLGLPWLLIILLRLSGTVVGAPFISVATTGLWISIIILLSSVLFLFFFLATGKKLTKIEGSILVLGYVAYVLWILFKP